MASTREPGILAKPCRTASKETESSACGRAVGEKLVVHEAFLGTLYSQKDFFVFLARDRLQGAECAVFVDGLQRSRHRRVPPPE